MSLFCRFRIQYEHPHGYYVERRKWYWFGWEAIGRERLIGCFSMTIPYYCKTIEEVMDIITRMELSVRF